MKTKKLLISMLLGVLYSWCAHAQSWQPVGNAGFSPANINGVSMAMFGTTPYVAFSDNANGGKAMVMKFDGSNWVIVGSSGFSAGVAGGIQIDIDKSGTPYVAYVDGANSNKETVMKFDGSNWVLVGAAGFSAPVWYYNALALDTAGVPYIAYFENFGACCQGHTHVMKFDGSLWSDVGALTDGTDWITLAFDTNNVLYFICNDYGLHWPNAYYYDGINWILVVSGLNHFAGYGTLTIDHKNNVPHLAIQDASITGATVYKLDGSNWVTIGNAGFGGIPNLSPSIAVDSSSVPYISFVNIFTGYATVMNYDGSNWVNVGNSTDSTQNSFVPISFDNNNIPYVAFSDANNGDKATVINYINTTGLVEIVNEQGIRLFPNPATDNFTVSLNQESMNSNLELEILNVLGEKIYNQKINSESYNVHSALPGGIYMVKVTDGDKQYTQKLIIQ